MSTEFEIRASREFAETVAGLLEDGGVPRSRARAQVPAMAAAFLDLVADGAIHVLEDGILIRDQARLEAIVLAGVPAR